MVLPKCGKKEEDTKKVLLFSKGGNATRAPLSWSVTVL